MTARGGGMTPWQVRYVRWWNLVQAHWCRLGGNEAGSIQRVRATANALESALEEVAELKVALDAAGNFTARRAVQELEKFGLVSGETHDKVKAELAAAYDCIDKVRKIPGVSALIAKSIVDGLGLR